MKRALNVLILVALALAVAACGANNNGGNSDSGAASTAEPSPSSAPASSEPAAPTEITVTHALGETVVPVNPEKVVVFDYGTLDTFSKLGIEPVAVPQGNLPAYLSQYEDSKYANAGTLFEPDFEKINELEPDVIFIAGRTSEAYEELSKIAPTVQLTVDAANYMESFENNVKTIGEIFGKTAEAEAELAAVHAQIDALNEAATADGGKALIILTTGGKVSAYGPGSRFGILHDAFGFAAADPGIEVSNHGMSISFEFIAEKNPDYLFVIDRDAVVTSAEGAVPAKELIENDLVKGTNAYKNGNIVYLDPGYWYLSGGGLVSVSEMVKEVQTAFE